MTAFPVAKLLQRSPEDTDTLRPSPSNERERKVRGRVMEEEMQMGKKIEKEDGGMLILKEWRWDAQAVLQREQKTIT